MRQLADEGLIERRTRGPRQLAKPPADTGDAARPTGPLPPVAVFAVLEVDSDGEVWGAPTRWDGDGPAPRVRLVSRARAPGVGDRVLARVTDTGEGPRGSVLRVLDSQATDILGVYEITGGEGRIRPTDKRLRAEYRVRGADAGGARPGDVVVAEALPGGPGLRRARVRSRVGALDDPRTLSLIAIQEHDIRNVFAADAVAEAEAARVPPLDGRADFRAVPFVTIDPEDARDFDDAIWAEPDGDGWRLRVAIADVAACVRPGTALDTEARARGNSVYFPDRVVPMLPEALSGGICSLQPDKDRACLVAEMRLDGGGEVRAATFHRALMRSARRFTYAEAQRIHDHGGTESDQTLLAPAWAAYRALARARDARQPLDIVTTELDVRLGDDGHVADVHPRPHLEAHRLIEAYMIAANVAAVNALAATGLPVMYRVHDEPEAEKTEALRRFLDTLGYRLAKGVRLRPHHFNSILTRANGTPHAEAVHQAVLRSQSQAAYSPANIGHFGLALPSYVHFTSPIRRYADLLVHRALISALGLGDDGLAAPDIERFAETAVHISATERTAMAAERSANARYLAAFLSARVGARFAARISGVGRAGVFVTFADTGADALVPLRTFADDHYTVDEAHQCIVGRDSARTFRLGDAVEVELLEAVAATGGLIAAITGGGAVDAAARKRAARAPRRASPGPGPRPRRRR